MTNRDDVRIGHDERERCGAASPWASSCVYIAQIMTHALSPKNSILSNGTIITRGYQVSQGCCARFAIKTRSC